MAKTKGAIAPQEKSPELLRSIIDVLFPHHPISPWPPAPYAADEGEVARVTNEELAEVVKSFASNKAPEPDGIPNVALKAVIADPDMFRTTH